ncbi:tail sheath stabilizer and completion protein [uncultured Caudovirales phage]|uniref:Tail sheath stabilizer and completion protein n=1 Tax=uncultured Caudovirales phage TaxID=2100421 RepID=A0A6J7X634_9CAUD|nr:tail sheath stabilizer and completion protein [uncultured Caudovirales phage]
MITQFVTAFDNIVIKRYNNQRVPQSKVQVRYVYSPKQRVLYDLVNYAQNITLPVVSVSIANISRDESRVFNKINGFYISNGKSDIDKTQTTTHYRSPVPVNITVNMSILTKFQSDMDQILSNFIPYNNPYIILSWKVPEDLSMSGFAVPQEIRSEVLWCGSVNMSYPTDIAATDKYKITGDTSFTIKGWLFLAERDPVGNIFYIKENFYNTQLITSVAELTATEFSYPSNMNLSTDVERISSYGYPQITNSTTFTTSNVLTDTYL